MALKIKSNAANSEQIKGQLYSLTPNSLRQGKAGPTAQQISSMIDYPSEVNNMYRFVHEF